MIKIILKYPKKKEEMNFLAKRVSYIKATLILNGVDNLKADEKEKEKLLFNIIAELEKKLEFD